MKNLLLLLAIVLWHAGTTSYAQILDIGDSFPDIKIQATTLDGKQQPITLSDLRGQLTILDFWNINCTACIASFPKLDSLQKVFGHKLKIILITKDTKEQVQDLFKRVKVKRPAVTMLVNDATFNAMFPHAGEPYLAWLNTSGKVQHITSGYNANYNNIANILGGKDVQLSRINMRKYDISEPLLPYMVAKTNLVPEFYSMLTRGFEEHSRSSLNFIRDSAKNISSIRLVNQPLLFLYRMAFDEKLFWQGFNTSFYNKNNTRVIVQTKDKIGGPEGIEESDYDNWAKVFLYSYELKIKPSSATIAFEVLRDDLIRNLPYRAEVKDEIVPCLVLKVDKPSMLRRAASKVNSGTVSYNGGFIGTGVTLTEVWKAIVANNSFASGLPIIDHTKLAGNFDIELRCSLADLGALKKELGRYGLDLVQEKATVPMLVISDK